MEAPQQLQTAADERDDITITRREYEDEDVVAVDFGQGVDASLDVIGDTAIVIAGNRQFEFEIPPDATDVQTNDGILQIKSEA